MVMFRKGKYSKGQKVWKWICERATVENFFEVLDDGKFNLSGEEKRSLFLEFVSYKKLQTL